MKNIIFLFIGLLLFCSCTEVNQIITIPLDGDIEQKISLDFSSLSEEDQQQFNIAPFFYGTEVPEKFDTTYFLGNESFKYDSELMDKERILMNKASVRFDYDTRLDKKYFELNIEYSNEAERTELIDLLEKLLGRGNDSKDESFNVPNFLLESISKYTNNRDLGLITFKDIELPKEWDLFKDLKELSQEELDTLAMMIPGEVKTRLVLPGTIQEVKGTENYKIIGGNTVEITTTIFDVLMNSNSSGYVIEYNPGAPVTDPSLTEVWEPEPLAVVARDKNKAPSDAIVLFGDGDASGFRHYDGGEVKWKASKKELKAQPGTGDIRSKQDFGSCQLHLEWKSPKEPNKSGQDKGNSGVYLAGKYEVQILNSYENRTYSNGQAGAVYKQHIPLVNATSPTGDWNTYDIIYHAPEFSLDGTKTKSGRLTVLHNGVLIQDHVEILGTTEYIGRPKNIAHGHGPIILQEHNNYVSYRNVWIRPL